MTKPISILILALLCGCSTPKPVATVPPLPPNIYPTNVLVTGSVIESTLPVQTIPARTNIFLAWLCPSNFSTEVTGLVHSPNAMLALSNWPVFCEFAARPSNCVSVPLTNQNDNFRAFTDTNYL